VATIAFFQNRLGRTDGVSLEVDKWRRILQDKLGHRVIYCSGNDDVPGNLVVPELYAQHPQTWKILQNATVVLQDYDSEAALEYDIYQHADRIEAKLLKLIKDEKIDLLIPNNLCSGGYQPAAAIAFHRVIRKTGLPAIIHSHDFYFEDSGEVKASCQTVASIYDRYFPPKLPRVQHVFINCIAQNELKVRKNIDGIVVPNVFDFDQEPWLLDDWNADFRSACGIGKDDLVFLQATRILNRKGIEMAIDTLARLQDPQRLSRLAGVQTAAGGCFSAGRRIVLLCAGIVETIGISSDYWHNLQEHASQLGVDLVHVGDRVRHSRGRAPDGSKVYSLWDSYVQADFVSYPSYWEGWGNQLVEALFARLPVLLFEYPVWTSDLAPKGFKVVSLGKDLEGRRANGLVYAPTPRVEQAADEIVDILIDQTARKTMVDHNFSIAKHWFSMENLAGFIVSLLQGAGL
jgi:glycosyltransferase involved in cell wall biosynthesis